MFFLRWRSLSQIGAQPWGQVGRSLPGVTQVGGTPPAGPWGSQQSWPALQQVFPQQNEFAPQRIGARHVGAWHIPLRQNDVTSSQTLPQVPQLNGSFWRLTQNPSQHIRPSGQVTAAQLFVPAVPPRPALPLPAAPAV